MSGSVGGKGVEPNLTPILDMVFQLITFFMLVINFKANLIDKAMELPVVGTARAVDPGESLQMLINVNNKGQFTVGGQVIPEDGIMAWVQSSANRSRMTERRLGRIKEDTDDLTTEIIVRADRATPFHKLNVVLTALRDAGYRKFSYRAMDKAIQRRIQKH